MKVYLVGGAVRDRLLNYPVKEQDWVVIGATPTDLTNLGYRPVGRDFPVFLHPQTQEEYALARTERKMAPGYHGFVCDFNPHVTLEDDLARRDLTINAMAMDVDGHLIDPYGGQADLQNKIIRHVSPAFIEDPVRVLRVARFMARYHHLGFVLAPETRQLMYAMVRRGELSYLVAERVWQEWQRSLQERNPACFIQTLRDCGALSVVLPEIHALFGVPNACHYHPEVDSGIHTLNSLQAAVGLSNEPKVRFAALVHDLGKARTPMAQWPAHHEHEMRGLPMIESLAERLRIPADYRQLALVATRVHLNVHRLYTLRPQTAVTLLENTDAFRRPQLFEHILLVCEADARAVDAERAYSEANHWRELQQACAGVNAQHLLEKGLRGDAIKQALHQCRVVRAEQQMKAWERDEK